MSDQEIQNEQEKKTYKRHLGAFNFYFSVSWSRAFRIAILLTFYLIKKYE